MTLPAAWNPAAWPRDGARLVLRNAQLLGADGQFRQGSVAISDGVFSAGPEAGGVELDAEGLWLTPGFVDAHTHLAWRAFDAAERAGLHPDQQRSDVRRNANRTLAAGVTSVRDAGGLPAGHEPELGGLRAALSVGMLGAPEARGPAHLRGRVQQLAEAGASWIKILATGGVGAGERALDPVFEALELKAIHVAAAHHGLPVMVHAWGGEALTQALDFGAASVEHAVLISDAQCRTAAAQGTYVVPTVWIYRDVLAMVRAGALPEVLAAGASLAVEAHPAAIRRCLEAGVQLALGTDAGLDSQHGRNLTELAVLIETGVPAETALLAGTAGGARLLGRPDLGTLRPGSPADLVCFDADPRLPEVLRDPRRVVAVAVAGRLVRAAGDR